MIRWRVAYEVSKTTIETHTVFASDVEEARAATEAFLRNQGYVLHKCVSVEDIQAVPFAKAEGKPAC